MATDKSQVLIIQFLALLSLPFCQALSIGINHSSSNLSNPNFSKLYFVMVVVSPKFLSSLASSKSQMEKDALWVPRGQPGDFPETLPDLH
jgi:hypothetical protein